jgi:beta-glucosidase
VQQQLLEALVATGKPVIVVMTGGVHNLQGWEDKVAALMMAWAPGQEGAGRLRTC